MASATISSQAENDSASMSGSDSKKRNKLGYHRTAVACGHCRRRKIRCVPSNDPSETKCANCIRLKKECQFYPVDQNGSNTRKHRSNSRAEPSADESALLKASASPDHPPSSLSDSFETPYAGRTSSSTAWIDSAGVVTSPPGRLGSIHTMDQQEWTQSPSQSALHNQFSQPDSHASTTAGTYWMQTEGDTAMDYQQNYGIAVTSGAYIQDSSLAYHNNYQDTRHNIGRQSINGIPSSGVDHSPNSYRYYNGTFPQIEESTTMSVNMFNNGTLHATPQLVAGPGQVMYDQNYHQQTANHTQAWFSSPSQHSTFPPQYLQTHQKRKYPQYS